MVRVLYDLAGADDRRFSPHCWKSKMALKHKELDFKTEPCTFLEVKEKVAFADWERVPALADGDTNVGDSWAIAEYLERTYPDAPSLFGSSEGKAFARFSNEFANTVLHPQIAGAIVYDIHDRLVEADREYFRISREAAFKRSFDDLRNDREAFVTRLRAALAPVRNIVSHHPFLSGEKPTYADYCIFGALQWARCSSDYPLLSADDPVLAWRNRILEMFGGYGASEPAALAA